MLTVTLRVVIPLVFLVMTALGFSRPTNAEPQILGVVRTSAPLPMRCENGECTANLATFCLEADRFQPKGGEAYRPADLASLRITRLDSQGRRVVVKAQARYHSDYLYTSVRVIVPNAATDGNLFISALPGAALMPLPLANDKNPHTPGQISLALGQARRLASAYFENGDPEVEDAQLLNRALSLRPSQGRVKDAERTRIWRDALKSSGPVSAKGIARGTSIYGMCQETAKLRDYYNMRDCLRRQSKQLLGNPNAELWKSMKTSS